MRAQAIEDELITANAERDAAITALNAAIVERDAAMIARDAANAARDIALARRDLAIADRDAARAARNLANAEAAELQVNAAVLRFAIWFAQKRVLFGLLRRTAAGRAEAIHAGATASGSLSFLSQKMITDLCQTRVLLGLLRRPEAFCHALITAGLPEAARLHIRQIESGHRNAARFDASRENVILVVHETSRTGAPILGWNIARLLAARYNLFIVCIGGGALTPEFQELAAETYGPFPGAGASLGIIDKALDSMFENRSFRYAVINSTESRVMVEVCAHRVVPAVFLVHEFATYVHSRADLRRAFDRAAEIVFPAQLVMKSAAEVYPSLHQKNVSILPQGMSEIPRSGGNDESSEGIADQLSALTKQRAQGAFIVVGAGTVSLRKGVDLFIAAAAAVRRANLHRPLQFVWVGHGYAPAKDMGYSIYLKEQIERAGLTAEVTFLGEVSDMEPVYALANAFFLSSRLDPLPNVSIDAAMRGLPIVCFADASGIAELLLSDPETKACVVAHLDVEAAAQYICRLASDGAAATEIAAATARLAQKTFNMERYVEQIDTLGRRHGQADLEISPEARKKVA